MSEPRGHPAAADLDDYREFQAELGLSRVVVVQPTTYGLDNQCQLEHVADLCAGRSSAEEDPGDESGRALRLRPTVARIDGGT